MTTHRHLAPERVLLNEVPQITARRAERIGDETAEVLSEHREVWRGGRADNPHDLGPAPACDGLRFGTEDDVVGGRSPLQEGERAGPDR